MNQRIRAVAAVKSEEIADNRTKVIASTNELARDGHIVEPSGLKVANFLRSSAILFNHNSEHPIATPISAALIDGGDKLEVEIEWPPAGVSAKSDEVRGLVKAGVIRAVSIGFLPTEMEPLDPKDPWCGQHIIEADLIELSFVGAPADTGAIVTQRSDGEWKCGASRTLPIDDSDSWDGPAAEKAIFAWAGGDDFNPSKARKGFLAYNAAKPKERGSYKLPIATVSNGKLVVPKGAIRAAASRLPQADIPTSVQAEARKVLDHYEEKADMGKTQDGDRSAATRRFTKQQSDDLSSAIRHHERAATHHKSVGNHLAVVDNQVQEARSAHEKARAAHDDLGEALEAARSEPEKAAEHIERAIKFHGVVEKQQRAVREAHNGIAGAHEDAESSHDDVGRCMREAHDAIKRAVGEVTEGADKVPGDDDNGTKKDGDSDAVQVSNGIQQDGGKTGRSPEWRKRRVHVLELSNPA